MPQNEATFVKSINSHIRRLNTLRNKTSLPKIKGYNPSTMKQKEHG
jgi:hypothetical protein